MLAFFSFVALREYFSLVDIRLQDRWGVLEAYISIPLLVLASSIATGAIESDLGISEDRLLPGTGQIIHGAKSLLTTAPVVFQYNRYFWEEPVFR